jgi:DNA-directed RNA polymerase subunit RPC12/RpoP
MPVKRPLYVDPYLEQLTGPGEQHNIDSNSHCVNPKCGQQFDDSMVEPDGSITCPSCGFNQNATGEEEPTWKQGPAGKPELNPGGKTRSGLSLDQMGQIGESVVGRLGELPGIGTVTWVSKEKKFPIDAILQSQRGKFGCEIKANHSQAQERFKIGGKEERQAKIVYCMTNGMKPALIGVRLNFYTDKAYVFFREGLTDTWIGNSKMQFVGTYDFSDLNPFKSPDPQAQALAVDNAHLTDQSEEDEFDNIFGTQKVAFDEGDHPRNDEGQFTVKADVHKLKVVNKKGKHTHNVIRCKHCGSSLQVPSEHKGRLECSTCGQDPERDLKLAKVVLADPRAADQLAKDAGWSYGGRSKQGHRLYNHTDENGTYHMVNIGAGTHGKSAGDLDAQFLRQRISRCMNGQCMHRPKDASEGAIAEPGDPVLRAGQIVNGQVVVEIDGNIALVQDLDTGKEDVVPAEHLLQQQAVGRTVPRGT